jgi:hypothetical protein
MLSSSTAVSQLWKTARNELLTLPADSRRKMGQAAQHAVSTFTVDRFAREWRRLNRVVASHVDEIRWEKPGSVSVAKARQKGHLKRNSKSLSRVRWNSPCE